ncbi:MAG: RNA-binding S4 domain-containing protein [Candidatus Didemnitutus sp.]|nr:RNA-binding S4 domain-containing protein [Candidatus Didemnitutus sp.]
MKKARSSTASTNAAAPRAVIVREVPIELCQLLKFAGVTESGGEAKQLIGAGEVLLNGVVETQKRKKLAAGDQVAARGQLLVVQLR